MAYDKNIANWAAFELDRRLKRASTPEEYQAVWREVEQARRDPAFRARLAQIAEHGKWSSGAPWKTKLGLFAGTLAGAIPGLQPLGLASGAALAGMAVPTGLEAMERRKEGLPWMGQAAESALDVGFPVGARLLRGLRGVKAGSRMWPHTSTPRGKGAPSSGTSPIPTEKLAQEQTWLGKHGNILRVDAPTRRARAAQQEVDPNNLWKTWLTQGELPFGGATPNILKEILGEAPIGKKVVPKTGKISRRAAKTTETPTPAKGATVDEVEAMSRKTDPEYRIPEPLRSELLKAEGVGGRPRPTPTGRATSFRLPQELVRASPRFGHDSIVFNSDLDKALYIVRNRKTQSRSHEKYMQALRVHFPGEADDVIRRKGDEVLARIKAGRVVEGQRVYSDPTEAIPTPSAQRPAAVEQAVEETFPSTGAAGVDEVLSRMRSSVDPENYLVPANVWLRQFLKTIDAKTLTALRSMDSDAQLTLVDRMLRFVPEGGPTSADYWRPMMALYAQMPSGQAAKMVKRGQKTGERLLRPNPALKPSALDPRLKLEGLPTERVLAAFRAGLNPREWDVAAKQIPVQFGRGKEGKKLIERFNELPTGDRRKQASIAYQAARHRFDVLTEFMAEMTGVKSAKQLTHPQIRRVEGVADRNLSRVIRGAAGGVLRKGEVEDLEKLTKQIQQAALQLMLLIGGTAVAQRMMPPGEMNAAAG